MESNIKLRAPHSPQESLTSLSHSADTYILFIYMYLALITVKLHLFSSYFPLALNFNGWLLLSFNVYSFDKPIYIVWFHIKNQTQFLTFHLSAATE